jgi:GTPase SAR1 family protein
MVSVGNVVTDGLDRLPTPTLEPHGDHLLHLTFLGSEQVGQSTVLRVFRRDEDFESRPSESFVVNVDLEGSPYRVRLSDMSAQPAFQQRLWSPRVGADGQDRDVQGTLGSAVMNTSDALIVCFSVAKRDSLEACEAKWVPDILMLKKKNKPQAPIVLLGLQTDLREKTPGAVTFEEGLAASERMGCSGYMECTALHPHTCNEAVYKVLLTAREFLYRKLQWKRRKLAGRIESDQTLQELHELTPTLGDLNLPTRDVPEFAFPLGEQSAVQTLLEDTHPLQRHQIRDGLGCLGVTVSGKHAFLLCNAPGLRLTSCDLLRGYKHLQQVDLSDNRLRALDFLDGLPFLLRLNASRNLLTSVGTFSVPRQLESVDLSYNLLGELGSWQIHRYLKELKLRGNFLEFLGPGLQLCESLRILDVSCNNLQDLEGLGALELAELYASANQLTSLLGTSELRHLRVFALADNHLKDLAELRPENHPVLMKLDVRHNVLAHKERVKTLELFPYLKDLYLSPNPLDQAPHYRMQTLHRIRTLRWLDDAPATAEEKVKADVIYGLEVQQKEEIHNAVMPREAFQDRRHVTEEDILEAEKNMFGQVGGFMDDVGDTTELYA